MATNESDRLSQPTPRRSLGSQIKQLGSGALFKWIAVFAIAFVAYWAVGRAWVEFGPQKTMLPPSRREMLPTLATQAVEKIREANLGLKKAVFLHFENDPSDEVSDAFRDKIAESGVLLLEPMGLTEKARRFVGIEGSGVLDIGQAATAARAAGVDLAITGKVEALQSTSAGAEARVQFVVVSSSGSRMIEHPIEFVQGSDPLAEASEAIRAMPGPSRFLLWILTVMLLPIITFGVVRSTVAKRANGPNFILLGLYTVIGMLLAYLLVGLSVSSWTSAVVFLAAFGVTVLYNLAVMRFALQLES